MEADIKPVARLPLTIDFPSLVNIIDKHVPFIIGRMFPIISMCIYNNYRI